MSEKTKLTPTDKTNYYLFAGLHELRDISKEWSGNIAFWQDEAKILKTLVGHNTAGILPELISHHFRRVESVLDSLSGTELPDLNKAIEAHKRHLDSLIEKITSDHETYRRKIHKDLQQNIHQLASRFRDLKKEIFELIEEVAIVNYNNRAHHWKGYTHDERNKVIPEISAIINHHGYILTSNMFSDIEISFIIKIQGGKVTELYTELSKSIKLDQKNLDVINPYKEFKIFLNVTFTNAG